MSWHLQQINNANGQGPTVPGEDVACPQATAPCAIGWGLFVCAFGDQLHFAYLDGNANILDGNANIQDCWYDGPTNSWNLQQINNPGSIGPIVPGEPVTCPQATAPFALGPFVCAFGDQLHFTYMAGLHGSDYNLQDCWYDGPTNSWNLQQINNAGGRGPTVPGEYVACPQATAPVGWGPFVSAFGDQLHFAYMASNDNLGGPVVLGGRTSPGSCGRAGSSAGQASGRLHHVPRRDLRGPAQLGREVLPQPDLLSRGRQGRPLRRLGGARAVRDRDPGGVQAAALTTARTKTDGDRRRPRAGRRKQDVMSKTLTYQQKEMAARARTHAACRSVRPSGSPAASSCRRPGCTSRSGSTTRRPWAWDLTGHLAYGTDVGVTFWLLAQAWG